MSPARRAGTQQASSAATGRDPIEDFEAIRRELALFSPSLGDKPQLAVATKMDTSPDPDILDRLEQHVRSRGLQFQRISAVAGTGLDELKESMWKYLSDARPHVGAPVLEHAERDA